MPTEYERLVEIEEGQYRKTLANLNNLEKQARNRGMDRALADFRKQNKEELDVDSAEA